VRETHATPHFAGVSLLEAMKFHVLPNIGGVVMVIAAQWTEYLLIIA